MNDNQTPKESHITINHTEGVVYIETEYVGIYRNILKKLDKYKYPYIDNSKPGIPWYDLTISIDCIRNLDSIIKHKRNGSKTDSDD